MDNAARSLLHTALHILVRRMQSDGIVPHLADAEVAAQYFRAVFQIPSPVTMRDMGVLLHRLALPEIYLRNDLYATKKIKGEWSKHRQAIRIYLDAARPEEEIVKALLHELGELVLAVGYDVHQLPRDQELSDKKRERWAQRFVAMVKMPPPLFRYEAFSCGLDLRHLRGFFEDTLAGVSRQVRDVCIPDKPFYVARFNVERHPERRCPLLIKTIEASGGLPVLMEDVVRTKPVDTRRRRGGALPPFNLPSHDQWRVMHPALHKCVETGQPLFIPSIQGGAAVEGGWGDLFSENDLAVIIRPYGIARVKGFFLLALHPRDLDLISDQLDRLCCEVREDVGWLFSWASQTKPASRRAVVQMAFSFVNDDGVEMDMGRMHPRPNTIPLFQVNESGLQQPSA